MPRLIEPLRLFQEGARLPESLAPLAAEMSLYTRNVGHALEVTKQAAADRPSDARTHLWLGLSLWAAGQRAEAEAALRRAVELDGTAAEHWVSLVRFLAGTEQKDRAEAVIRQAGDKLPADRADLALAQCWEVVGRRDQAEKHYRAALSAAPESSTALRAVAGFYLLAGQSAKAEPHSRKLLESARTSARVLAGDVAWARRNLAMVLSGQGTYRNFREALALLDLNRQLYQGETVLDRHTRARVLASRPCHQQEAISELLELGARQTLSVEDQYLLVQLYEGRGNWAEADRRLDGLLAETTGNPGFLAHAVRLKLRLKDQAAARRWLTRLEQGHPRTWEAVASKACLLAAQGKAADAVALLLADKEAGKQGDGEKVPAVSLAARAALLEELGQLAAAEKMYRAFVARSERPESVLVLVRFLGRQQRPGEAFDLCERAWTTCPPEAVASASVALVRASHNAAGAVERVDRWLETACRKHPDIPALLVCLADMRNVQGRYDEAERLYRQALDRDQQNAQGLNNLAWLLALRGEKANEARERINSALELVGPEQSLLDTRAVVSLALGQNRQALADLRQALCSGRRLRLTSMPPRSICGTRKRSRLVKH